ncbi:hypothetical protein ABZ618_18145 [Streptomyces roseolus]|uniref:hypothetical protein n=1 Tax=Streptomyces roseolus TaxID=67358 RepID=UPI00340AB50B
MRLRRPVAVAVPLALVPLLLAGCSEAPRSPDATTPAPVAPAGEPAPEETVADTDTDTDTDAKETEQGERAQEALGLYDDEDYVEFGLERVANGAHVRAVLERGEPYRLSVACVGTGAVKVTVGEPAPLSVACDGVPVRHRVGSAPAELPVGITGAAGAAGMVAWRIDPAVAGDGTDGSVPPADQAGEDDDDHDAGKPGRKVRR